jgi:hypothetical protein
VTTFRTYPEFTPIGAEIETPKESQLVEKIPQAGDSRRRCLLLPVVELFP